MYFLLLSAVLVSTAIFYTPFKFGVTVEVISIIKEYLKLAVVFLYFLIGFNLMHEKVITQGIKWYSSTALCVGSLGVFINFLGLKFLYQFYDFGEDRYNGFMNDPNYFAIVQISALPFFLRAEKIALKYKVIIYCIILASILISGSKTGFITLFTYTLLFIIGDFLKNKMRLKTLLITLFILIVFIILNEMLQIVETSLALMGENSVQFQRISLLFTDFNSAFNEGGSSRLPIWKAGIYLISLSPLVGVGVGMYSSTAVKVSGIDEIAHNTYIQSYTEWGGIFATIFFCYLAFILLKVTFSKEVNNTTNFILRDMLIILLIGSIAISFNNARMFWLFLGAIVYSTNHKQQRKLPNSFF